MDLQEIDDHCNMINEYLDHMETVKRQRIHKALFKNLQDFTEKILKQYYINMMNDSKYNESIDGCDNSVNSSFSVNKFIENPDLSKINVYLINDHLYRKDQLDTSNNMSNFLKYSNDWTCDYIIEIVGIVVFRNIETEKIIAPIDPRSKEEIEKEQQMLLKLFDDLLVDLDDEDEDCHHDNHDNHA